MLGEGAANPVLVTIRFQKDSHELRQLYFPADFLVHSENKFPLRFSRGLQDKGNKKNCNNFPTIELEKEFPNSPHLQPRSLRGTE